MFGKPKLAEKSPEVLAAIQTLGRSWGTEPRARELLQQATRSKDPEVRASVEVSP